MLSHETGRGRAASGRGAVESRRTTLAMREITTLMNAYRECSRNLWNVYFSKRENIGGSIDSFEQVRSLLFKALVVDELSYSGEAEGKDIPPPALRVVPRPRSPILIKHVSTPGAGGSWEREKDTFVGPGEITLAFIDYFDFAMIPIIDFRYYRCMILTFPSHAEHEGREALIEAQDGMVYHDEEHDDPA